MVQIPGRLTHFPTPCLQIINCESCSLTLAILCNKTSHRREHCLRNGFERLVAYSEVTLAFWMHRSTLDPFIFLFHLSFISKTTFDTVGMIQAAWTLLLLSLQYRGEGGNDKRSSCPFNSRRFWICESERGCWGNVFVQLLTGNVYFLQRPCSSSTS